MALRTSSVMPGGGRLFDDFLVAALEGAVTLEQVNRVACDCRQIPEFDMTGERMYFSISTAPSPNDACPSLEAALSADLKSFGSSTAAYPYHRRRAGFDKHGIADFRASAARKSGSCSAP